MSETMLEKLERIITTKKLITDELVAYFKNNDIPLEERWEAYKYAIDKNVFNEINSWSYEVKVRAFAHNNLSWYDDFNIERYQTITFPEVVDMIDDYDIDFSEEDIIELKEEFLQTGNSGFCNDW